MVKLHNGNHMIMVDDNEGDILLVQRCFQLSKLENPWLSFTSGIAFLDYLATVKQGAAPMPALVLLDINMPEMNGFEVLRQARSDPYFKDLPIFCMLTSSGDPRDMEKVKELGSSGYFTKSGDIDSYVALFDSFAAE